MSGASGLGRGQRTLRAGERRVSRMSPESLRAAGTKAGGRVGCPGPQRAVLPWRAEVVGPEAPLTCRPGSCTRRGG